MTKPLAIDLFCGLGGWSSALIEEGYRVIGFDIEAHEYGDQKYPGQLVLQDVTTLHGSQFKDAALIVASPPCQEYSYMAMPWSLAKAKAAAIRADTTGQKLEDLNRLFNACFRIQREACLAPGRHIPMVVENVRGAQPWVGRARWSFGSFYLWGDVPALMPSTIRATKVPGFRFDGSGGSFQTASVEESGVKAPGHGHGWKHPDDPRHTPGLDFTRMAGKEALEGRKNNGGSWFNIGSPGQKVVGQNPDGRMKPPARISAQPPAEGRKGAGAGAAWFDQNTSSLPSASPRRKAASAMIAKIPEALARHIARVFKP